ncbi:LEAF RUST 10 DISEASE-RESISTANCE LOCUS RECEPTOR-LIKE PROTEIN KINASE-like 2.1 isoform X1 [Solanum dulcamara]|uniref:LEAF RUST 10 DISEASE-RESISTANCE LOCUS RECEPTOR-LIKE PROTEIN KINASE-like 2.1 isoform X1 n=1 Tax=Solanum dulcamara TaxID=45834 RepID=UPI0024862BCF|nr:LEAF RUST 10 DISEASE-RESISTANCE LOCUS RECEPTOR-LIKE PROTEIN KINASE-like 2.1 isoform X1 [Solanum dulcamara]
MSIRNSFFASVFLFVTFITNSIAQSTSQCVPSSCGDIRDIKFPFRLRTDPGHCGKPGYELDCLNNQTIFLYESRKFYVQEINYRNFSIRLLDPSLEKQNDNCTVFPDHRASYDAMTSLIFGWLRVDNDINYVNCRGPINSSRYIPTSFCSTNTTATNSSFSYLVIGEILQASDLAGGCRVETVAWSAAPDISPNKSSSLSSIRQALAYGFDLSWRLDFLCRECGKDEDCIFENNSDVPTCIHYCKEDTPVSELSFGCKIEYYSVFVLAYGAIGIGALIALRYLVGIPILIAVVVWQCKRRNLNTSNDDVLGNKASSSEQNC